VPLQRNVHQGVHGEGFVFALASAAGLTTSKTLPDVDGIDWQIAYPGPKGTVRSPRIEMQVKSSSNPQVEDNAFKHRLSVKHHNAIAGPGFKYHGFLPWSLFLLTRLSMRYATTNV
jgi:hypothetical protein